MKCSLLCRALFVALSSFCVGSCYAMDLLRNANSPAIEAMREKRRACYYPDITLQTEQQHATATRCFLELLKLELYPSITFGDAHRYCEFYQMYGGNPLNYFCIDPSIIKRFINVVMFNTFYPPGSGSSIFGPPSGMEARSVAFSLQQVIVDRFSMSKVLTNESSELDSVATHTRLQKLGAALKYFKTMPARSKLEA